MNPAGLIPGNKNSADTIPSCRAVFLDRDGVISDNSIHYYLTRVEEFRFNPGVIEALSELGKRGYLLIVITNQGGISLGMNSIESVEMIHQHMQKLLMDAGVEITEIYYCPHHSDNEACLCRKPLPLMIEKAMARFRVDPARSWLIGDSQRDLEAGKAAGVRTLLIEPNSNLLEVLEKIG
jgi:D-glycero-D-manno-heptose 1,7-bisphosphate phosphatase